MAEHGALKITFVPPPSGRKSSIQRAVVTGGNGFIGSSLVAALVHSGTEVHALVNENHEKLDRILPPEQIHVLHDDARNAGEIVLAVKPDAIFHLAAVYAEPDDVVGVLRMIQGNLTLGTCLLYGCTHLEQRPVFVNTGTYWQFEEEGRFDPNTLYAASKQAFHDILVFYHRRLDVRSVTLALYDTYGEDDDRQKLWQRVVQSPAGTHLPLSLGVQNIYLNHIDDTVDAFLLAANLLKTQQFLKEVYAVRPESSFVLRTFLEELNARTGSTLSLGWGELPFWPGQVVHPWRGDTLPGWQPRHDSIAKLTSMTETFRRKTGH